MSYFICCSCSCRCWGERPQMLTQTYTSSTNKRRRRNKREWTTKQTKVWGFASQEKLQKFEIRQNRKIAFYDNLVLIPTCLILVFCVFFFCGIVFLPCGVMGSLQDDYKCEYAKSAKSTVWNYNKITKPACAKLCFLVQSM